MTVDFSSETTLCKRHHASYEEELRSDLKMLTIKSEEPAQTCIAKIQGYAFRCHKEDINRESQEYKGSGKYFRQMEN